MKNIFIVAMEKEKLGIKDDIFTAGELYKQGLKPAPDAQPIAAFPIWKNITYTYTDKKTGEKKKGSKFIFRTAEFYTIAQSWTLEKYNAWEKAPLPF